MIKPGEIQQKANLVGVRDQQIEKDYTLSVPTPYKLDKSGKTV